MDILKDKTSSPQPPSHTKYEARTVWAIGKHYYSFLDRITFLAHSMNKQFLELQDDTASCHYWKVWNCFLEKLAKRVFSISHLNISCTIVNIPDLYPRRSRVPTSLIEEAKL